MKKNSELKIGVILSYINLIIGNIIPLVYTPIMLRMLGKAEYGLYGIASSVIGYLSLLSFGMGSTIVRYITKYKVENEKEKEERVIGLFILVYSVLAILVLIGGFYLSRNSGLIFHKGLSTSEISKIKILIYIMTFNTAISFPISVFNSITIAHEKYLFRKIVDMLSTILIPIFNIVVLYLGFGSIGMSLVSTFIQFLLLPINSIYCFRVLKIKPIFKNIPFFLLKEIITFSAFVFLGSIVDMLFWSTDKIILGALVGAVATAVYSIGSTFSTMMQSFSSAISGILIPKVTEMVIKEKNKQIWTELFIKIGRLQYYIVALILSGFIIFGRQFIQFFAGDGYEDAYMIALLTMVPLSIPLIQNTGLNILVAQNKHQFRAVVYLIIAIINVIMTYLVVPKYGGIGAALCSSIAYLAGQGIVMNIYYYKVTGIDIPKFWKEIIHMSIVPIVMLIVFKIICIYISMNNIGVFLILIILFSVVYFILNYVFIMNDYEKSLFINPILKIGHNLKNHIN